MTEESRVQKILTEQNNQIDWLRSLFALVGKQNADRIKALANAHVRRIAKYADRIKELEAALREIVEQERQTAHPVVVHIIAIAREALEGKDGP